ncbi:MAG: glycosyltransferase 87 family protein [Hyphomicrobiales bacterium]
MKQLPETMAVGGLVAGWALAAGVLLAGTAAFTTASHGFGHDIAVRDMPVTALSLSLAAAGALFLLILPLLRQSAALPARTRSALLVLIAAAGLAARLMLLASEPVLEDDYQRYLWDGGVTASGLNPYAASPAAALAALPETELGQLAAASGDVLGRVNHPHLRTVYPPVAQGVFALAHRLSPWSLTAWRAVTVALELSAFALLIVLLRDVGRSPLWATLYWWNPIPLKEIANSAHMDVILLPLLLGALVLANRGRLLGAGASLLLAAGVKLWPVLLLPLIWRPLIRQPGRLSAALAMAALAGLAIAAPFIITGLNGTSGLLAYMQSWKTNSALTPVLEAAAGAIAPSGDHGSALLARMAAGVALGALALWTARTEWRGASELADKTLLLAAAMFLLSPAQFPWYYLWLLPLLAIRPVRGLLLLTATLPLYYLAFHFLARGEGEIFQGQVVWLIWLPVWALLAHDLLRAMRWRTMPAPRPEPAA